MWQFFVGDGDKVLFCDDKINFALVGFSLVHVENREVEHHVDVRVKPLRLCPRARVYQFARDELMDFMRLAHPFYLALIWLLNVVPNEVFCF